LDPINPDAPVTKQFIASSTGCFEKLQTQSFFFNPAAEIVTKNITLRDDNCNPLVLNTLG
jgi:hypothetical protein